MVGAVKAVGRADVEVVMAREALHLNIRVSIAVFEAVNPCWLVASLWKMTSGA